ncbi:uncharacterized protein LOC111126299 isoform X2 [Crassostrea virginica]
MSVGWDVKWCPVSRITTPLAHKRPFHWISMMSLLVRAARVDDPVWITEVTKSVSFSSKLRPRKGRKSSKKEKIKVAIYSENCKTTVELRKGPYSSSTESFTYTINSDNERLLFMEKSQNYGTGGLEYEANTDLTVTKNTKLTVTKKLEWEVVDIPKTRGYSDVLSMKRYVPIQPNSVGKWVYYGSRDRTTVFGQVLFSAVTKEDYASPSVTLNFAKTVKLYVKPRYSNTKLFTAFYERNQTFYKDISNSSRLYQCYIWEVNASPNRGSMYLNTKTSMPLLDLRYFSYRYVQHGYLTELYSIVRDPAYIIDDAICRSKEEESYDPDSGLKIKKTE